MLKSDDRQNGTVLPIPSNNETSYFDESSTEQDLKQIIRKMNLKVTPQRILILKTLHEGRVHITAQELYEKVQKINSDVGFATVYRFLKGMAEAHVVTELRMGSMPTRYELTPKKFSSLKSSKTPSASALISAKAIEARSIISNVWMLITDTGMGAGAGTGTTTGLTGTIISTGLGGGMRGSGSVICCRTSAGAAFFDHINSSPFCDFHRLSRNCHP